MWVLLLHCLLIVSIVTLLYWIILICTASPNAKRTKHFHHILQNALHQQPLLNKSATYLGQQIKLGNITASNLVDMFIKHIELVNPYLNAVVVNRFATAREEAAKADQVIDELRKRGEIEAIQKLPRFFGVPCTVKECFQVERMPISTGLISRRHVIAKTTCPAIQRIQDAGMIILGVTNVSELCLWMEAHNELYGRTFNPYNLDRTPGGSSGGEGAIISSCGAPVGIGSDVGGSIRMPSFFNGLFGHKATGGYVPNFGTYPETSNLLTRFCQLGPIVKYSEDLMPLLQIIAGPVLEEEKLMCFRPLKDPSQVDLRNLDFFSVADTDSRLLSLPVSNELRLIQVKAIKLIEKSLKTHVTSLNFKEFSQSFDIWAANMSLERSMPFHELLGGGSVKLPNLFVSLLRTIIGSSIFTIPAIGLAFLEKIATHPVRSHKFRKIGFELQAKLEEKLQNGVLLFPSHPIVTPRHNVPVLIPFNFHYTGIFNVLELPATQVPLGLNSEGVPLGVQIVSARHNDHLTIAVARHLEELFGGYRSPGS